MVDLLEDPVVRELASPVVLASLEELRESRQLADKAHRTLIRAEGGGGRGRSKTPLSPLSPPPSSTARPSPAPGSTAGFDGRGDSAATTKTSPTTSGGGGIGDEGEMPSIRMDGHEYRLDFRVLLNILHQEQKEANEASGVAAPALPPFRAPAESSIADLEAMSEAQLETYFKRFELQDAIEFPSELSTKALLAGQGDQGVTELIELDKAGHEADEARRRHEAHRLRILQIRRPGKYREALKRRARAKAREARRQQLALREEEESVRHEQEMLELERDMDMNGSGLAAEGASGLKKRRPRRRRRGTRSQFRLDTVGLGKSGHLSSIMSSPMTSKFLGRRRPKQQQQQQQQQAEDVSPTDDGPAEDGVADTDSKNNGAGTAAPTATTTSPAVKRGAAATTTAGSSSMVEGGADGADDDDGEYDLDEAPKVWVVGGHTFEYPQWRGFRRIETVDDAAADRSLKSVGASGLAQRCTGIRATATADLEKLKRSYGTWATQDAEWESQRRRLGYRLARWVEVEADRMLEKEVTVSGGERITYSPLFRLDDDDRDLLARKASPIQRRLHGAKKKAAAAAAAAAVAGSGGSGSGSGGIVGRRAGLSGTTAPGST